ncbi:hypothetical protein FHX81_5350 [Saccharothrix saharensis]|uniref:HicA-like toxin of HicAB toxin-antitoxin system n=1 Tax=Saccharothrix saharensis TaxID=571190 RepID=A0A543JJK8_9PSEU|nr:hypothetical protein FHX81_5350 [Saccharothrix saharensis]
MRKEVRKLLEELERQGFTYRVTSKQHYMVFRPSGQWAATIAGTASDSRSLANAISELRNAGFVWRR